MEENTPAPKSPIERAIDLLELAEIQSRARTRQWEGINRWVWLLTLPTSTIQAAAGTDLTKEDVRAHIRTHLRDWYEAAIKGGWPPGSPLDNWMEDT